MLVCICTGMTADDIRGAVAKGARTVEEVSDSLGGVGTICELCHEVILDLIAEAPAEPQALRTRTEANKR